MLIYSVLLLFLILKIPSVASVASATPIFEAETVANDLNNAEVYYDRANAKLAGDKEGAIEDYSRASKTTILSTLPIANSNREDIALSQKRKFDIKRASIGGLQLGISEKEVIKKLGLPKSRKTGYSPCGDNNYISLKYNGLNIELTANSGTSKFHVDFITTTSSQYYTNTGIKVGDSMNKARQKYLKGTFNDTQEVDELCFSDPQYNWSGIVFYGKKAVIRSITISVENC
jgi:hypothetical protein